MSSECVCVISYTGDSPTLFWEPSLSEYLDTPWNTKQMNITCEICPVVNVPITMDTDCVWIQQSVQTWLFQQLAPGSGHRQRRYWSSQAGRQGRADHLRDHLHTQNVLVLSSPSVHVACIHTATGPDDRQGVVFSSSAFHLTLMNNFSHLSPNPTVQTQKPEIYNHCWHWFYQSTTVIKRWYIHCMQNYEASYIFED